MQVTGKTPFQARSNQMSLNELWENLEWVDRVSIATLLFNSFGLDVLKIPAGSALKKYVGPLLKKTEQLKKQASSSLPTGNQTAHVRGLMLCVLKLWCLRQMAYREMLNQNRKDDIQPLIPERIANDIVQRSNNP